MRIRFDRDVKGMQLMAAYVSELVKQSVVFVIKDEEADYVTVELTGGF